MASNGFSTLGASSSQRHNAAAAPASNLNTLLLQANSLSRNNNSDLPQLRYGIEEIERLSEGPAGRAKRTRNGDGLQLLSSIGVNASQINQSINNLPSAENGAKRRRARGRATRPDALPEIGPSYAVGDGDVASWGRNWHETIILSGIEYQRQRTVKAFNEQFQRRMLDNWEADKARIMQDELGVTDEEVRSATAGLGQSTLGRSQLGGSVRKYPSGPSSGASKEGDLAMHTKQTRYNEVVSNLNRARLNKQPFELAQAFEDVARTDTAQPQLKTTFRILAHLMHEPSLADEASAPVVRERQYAQTYLNEMEWRGQKGAALRGRLVSGAKRYLEKDFESHMDEVIAKKPKAAALGGLPGFENKARAFVDALFRTEDKQGFTELRSKFSVEPVNDVFLYAQVYFLLRAGHYADAVDCLSSKANTLRSSDSALPAALKAWVENNQHLPEQHRIELRKTWDLDIRNKENVDQFRVALYKIIGRIDMAKKGVKVATSTEDWVWVNLMLTREGLEDSPVDKYTLKDFATVVAGLPRERYDQKGQKPLVWVNLLLQAGEFEEAVAYLYEKAQSRTDAVHLAVVLQYYGLLRLADPNDTILSYEESGPTCNFARMVRNYISPIARVEPASALQYTYLVAMGAEGLEGESKRKEQTNLAISLVQDVVLASRAWSKLLGTVRADGSKQPGLIEQHFPLLNLPSTDEFFRKIVLSSAEQSALDSSLIDSIELYHLANAPDKVIETVNRALGASLSIPNANSAVSSGNDLGISGAFGGVSDLYSLAGRVRDVYERDVVKRSKIPAGAWETLGVLVKLKLGLSQFAEGRADLALETFKATGILPLDPDPAAIAPAQASFKALLDQPTISSLDEIVITAMKCLHTLYQSIKESPYGDQGRMQQMEALRGAARGLVVFGSGLRLRLGADVYRQLSSLSAFF